MKDTAVRGRPRSGSVSARRRRTTCGRTLGKYLLLLAFLALFVGWYVWRSSFGAVGNVARMAESTRDYIAFLRTDDDGACNLFIVRSDGSDLRQLTNDDAPKRMPAWSPDGRRLCYAQESRAEGSATYQLFVIGQGTPRQITYGSFSKDMPQWRPDGKLIGFLSGGAIKVVSPNAADVEQIYPRPRKGSPTQDGEESNQPSPEDVAGLRRPPITFFRWSTKGQSLAGVQVLEGESSAVLGSSGWWSQGPGLPEVFAGDPLSEPESIVVLPHLNAEPFVLPGAERVLFDWLPDGRRIVASLITRQGRNALVRFRTDEKNLPVEPLLTADKGTIICEQLVVSPDGKQIAFELWRSLPSGDRQLKGVATVPAEIAEPVVLRKIEDLASTPIKIVVEGDARRPRWSPDGGRLLVHMPGSSGKTDLVVVSLKDGKKFNLTKGVGDNTDGTWSPVR